MNENIIRKLSNNKLEPNWMLDFRLKAFKEFLKLPNPDFGPKLNIDFNKITYYKKPINEIKDKWDDVDCDIRTTFTDLGVIQAEIDYLGGSLNQVDSNVVYKKNKEEEIIFLSTDEALQKHPQLFKKYFNTLVKYNENKYTALNSAFWSGGVFIYVPKNTKITKPLQSYFRIDSEAIGQFERTLIIVDDGAELDYIEGCTAQSFATNSLHAGVVEIFVGKGAKCRYSTIQNWSKDVYNLVTKRAIVEENGSMEWVDGNLGSLVTMKYPSCILKGDNSKGNSISIAYAKKGQRLDAGAKMIHLGKNTKSNILSKSISVDGGISDYRGLVKITKNATNSFSQVNCENILLDNVSKTNAYPTNITENENSYIEHEATVSKLSEEKTFYLMSKGLGEEAVKELLILGFIDEFKKSLPMEYAVELNRLLKE